MFAEKSPGRRRPQNLSRGVDRDQLVLRGTPAEKTKSGKLGTGDDLKVNQNNNNKIIFR
jgi:hypothetical protein